jgi:hypothetical protein
MNAINEIVSQLTAFRDSDKFEAYKDRQPAIENSTKEDKEYINVEINSCCNQLLKYLEKDSAQEEAPRNRHPGSKHIDRAKINAANPAPHGKRRPQARGLST